MNVKTPLIIEDKMASIELTSNEPAKYQIIKHETSYYSSFGTIVLMNIETKQKYYLKKGSEVLEFLALNAKINKGFLEEDAVFIRINSSIFLVPLSSDIYKEARENTDKLHQKISKKDIVPGTIVNILGLTGDIIYLGKFSIIFRDSYYKTKMNYDENIPMFLDQKENKLIPYRKKEIKYLDILGMNTEFSGINSNLDFINSEISKKHFDPFCSQRDNYSKKLDKPIFFSYKTIEGMKKDFQTIQTQNVQKRG